MARVNDLLHLQRIAIQILATGAEQPTVTEISDRAEAGEIVPYLIELGNAAGVDTSLLTAHLLPSSDAGRAVAASIQSIDNVLDTERKYGMGYGERLGLLVLLWWVIDQIPAEALEADNGW